MHYVMNIDIAFTNVKAHLPSNIFASLAKFFKVKIITEI